MQATFFVPCNFRCAGHSWRWQGWPKRRTWGDRNSRHPRGIRSEGTLWATRTLWPIDLFKQNSSSLHVQRKEVSKLQKSLKSQLTDKLQIPSCYQDPVLGLLQTSRWGCGSNVPTWNHGFQETTQRETETRHRCRTLYRCLILRFYDWSCFSSWGQMCRTISVQYNILKPPNTPTRTHSGYKQNKVRLWFPPLRAHCQNQIKLPADVHSSPLQTRTTTVEQSLL